MPRSGCKAPPGSPGSPRPAGRQSPPSVRRKRNIEPNGPVLYPRSYRPEPSRSGKPVFPRSEVRLTTTIGETGGKIHTQFPSAAARFYRSSLLAEANAADHRLRAARRDSGPLQSAMHPWPPTPGTAQPTDGGSRPRTAWAAAVTLKVGGVLLRCSSGGRRSVSGNVGRVETVIVGARGSRLAPLAGPGG
jgi:hypothetical protein